MSHKKVSSQLARAEILLENGQLSPATQLLRESGWALVRRGAAEGGVATLRTLGRVLLTRGRASEALRVFSEIRTLPGHRAEDVTTETWMAWALVDAGRWPEAVEAFRRLLGHHPDAYQTGWLVAGRARLEMLSNSSVALDSDTATSLVEWRASEDGAWAMQLRGIGVEALLSQGLVNEAGHVARRLLTETERAGSPLARAYAHRAHGAVMTASGDFVLARQSLMASMRWARQAGARCCLHEARLNWWTAACQAAQERESARVRRQLVRTLALLPDGLRRATAIRLSSTRAKGDDGAPGSVGPERTGRPVGHRGVTEPALPDIEVLPGVFAVSRAMRELALVVRRAAQAPFPVLIVGESGTGKELVARALHTLGTRGAGPFCEVNCAAFADDLIDAELFGHARGAFTGAVEARPGVIESASGGTLFLDEVADLSLRAQAKLLRVLQQHDVRRLGEVAVRRVDIRVVAAANQDLEHLGTQGRFRADLRFRLDVVRIRVPPLRERPDDVLILANRFWDSARKSVASEARLHPDVLARLAKHSWPGNVRELQNVLAALAVHAPRRGVVRRVILSDDATTAPAAVSPLTDARADFERGHVERVMAYAAGNQTEAAHLLGLSRQGLRKTMLRLGLHSYNVARSRTRP